MLLPSVHVDCAGIETAVIHLVSVDSTCTTAFSGCANCERAIAAERDRSRDKSKTLDIFETAKSIPRVCIRGLDVRLLIPDTGAPIEHIDSTCGPAAVVGLVPIDSRGAARFTLGAHCERIAQYG